jgi:hypothetical protein
MTTNNRNWSLPIACASLVAVLAMSVDCAGQTREVITGESYWYTKTLDRVLSESDTGDKIVGVIQARHGLSDFELPKKDVLDAEKKNQGLKMALEELINWLDTTSRDFAQSKLQTLTRQSFADRDAWAAWWRTNSPFLTWWERTNQFIVDEEAKNAGVPTDQYRKTHPWPQIP